LSFLASTVLLVLANHGSPAAQVRVPDIDHDTGAGGIELLSNAALLLFERLHRR
jgi:hypothetical protein